MIEVDNKWLRHSWITDSLTLELLLLTIMPNYVIHKVKNSDTRCSINSAYYQGLGNWFLIQWLQASAEYRYLKYYTI